MVSTRGQGPHSEVRGTTHCRGMGDQEPHSEVRGWKIREMTRYMEGRGWRRGMTCCRGWMTRGMTRGMTGPIVEGRGGYRLGNHLLQRDHEGEGGQEHHREETVSKHTHDAAHGYTHGAHQVQNNVHTATPQQANTIDVAKMHLP